MQAHISSPTDLRTGAQSIVSRATLHPQPGQRWTRDGLVRHVREVSGGRVAWDVEGVRGGAGASSVELWSRWAKHAVTAPPRGQTDSAPAEAAPGPVAESEPANVTTAPIELCERDAAALRAVLAVVGPDGWARPRAVGALLDNSGLSRSTFQRAAANLVAMGVLDVDAGDRATKRATAFRPTELAHEIARGLVGGLARASCGLVRGLALRESDKKLGYKNKDSHSLSSEASPELAHGLVGGLARASSSGLVGGLVPAGQITVPLPADPAHAARVLRAIADALSEPVSHASRTDLAPVSHVVAAPPVDLPPVSPPTSPRNTPTVDHRASLGRVLEVWAYELQLPASRSTGCEQTWAGLHADGMAPPKVEAVIAGLKREAPKWHAKAAEEKRKGENTDPWRWTPKLRNWLSARSWEAGPDPAPRDGPAPKPELSGEAKARIEELRKKAETHERVGDHAMARDYRRQVDQIKQTGRIP